MAKLTVDEATLKQFEGHVPRHVAVIMDGNGRWAVQRGMARIRGHHEGANAVRRVVESCRYLGVEILTLYAFSSQNWGRPEDEVSGLMTLFDLYIKKERNRLLKNGIRMQVIGDRGRLSPKLQKAIGDLEDRSAANTGMILQVAVSYGGREEITQAARRIAEDAVAGKLDVAAINEATISDYLYTRGRLDPDLVIRTSGECRVSNFLLWQIAYSELHITETLWPDFDETQLIKAFEDYSARERRFGQTSAQVDERDAPGDSDSSVSEV